MGGVSGHGQKNKPHKAGRHAGRSAREKHAKSKGQFLWIVPYCLARGHGERIRNTKRRGKGKANGIHSLVRAADGCGERHIHLETHLELPAPATLPTQF